MRIHNIHGIHLMAWLTVAAISPVSAQEAPRPWVRDAPTMVADFFARDDMSVPLVLSSHCPDEHPWFRAIVDGLAAVEPTSRQAWIISFPWSSALHCDDPVINQWFSRALDYATDRDAGEAIAKGLLMSDRPEHLAALRSAIFSNAVSDVVRGGVLLGVNKAGTVSFRAEIFLAVLRQDKFPSNDYFNREINQLMRSEIKEEFMVDAAAAVRARPESTAASFLLTHLALGAIERPGASAAVSDNAARAVLRVIEALKGHPAQAAARAHGAFGGAYESMIRARLAGGGLDR